MATNPHTTNNPMTGASQDFAQNGLFNGLPWMNALFGEIFGANDQYRSQEWQDYMLTREQEFATDYKSKMQAAIDAGINPNVAAGAVIGAPSPSAPSSPNGSSAGAAGLGSMASMLGNAGGAAEAMANAGFTRATQDASIQEILARTHKSLTSAGVDDKVAQRMALENVFVPLEHQLGLANLQASIDLQREQIGWYSQSVTNLKAEIRQINENIKLMQSQGNLADIQALVAQSQQKQLELQNYQLSFDNNLRKLLHVNPNNPMEENIFIRSLQGIDTQQDVDLIETINFKRANGEYSADVNTSFERSYNEAIGRLAADSDYKPYLDNLEVAKQAQIEFYRALAANPNDVQGVLAKYVNSIFDLCQLLGVRVALPNGKDKKPVAMPIDAK